MSGNMVSIGNKHVPPSAVHQQERCPVPSLYGQQKEWNPDQPWVMDGAQNLNIMNMPQVFLFF
jgi:hypothetical protein